MEPYLDVLFDTIQNGTHRDNRTAVDDIRTVSQNYSVDLRNGFPLLTTKQLSGRRWETLVKELMWFMSGDNHIEYLQEEGIPLWNPWTDENGNVESSYGRFWRRYPIPEQKAQLPGEEWPDPSSQYVNEEVSEEGETFYTFDQLKCYIDALNGENPNRGPNSRRLVMNAFHPPNAAASGLPPCHFACQFLKEGDNVHLVLNQRSGDLGLGVPFNLAQYSLLLTVVGNRTGLTPATVSHNIGDAHVYCGKNERGQWYADNLNEIQKRLEPSNSVNNSKQNRLSISYEPDYLETKEWIESNAPDEWDGEERYDHLPHLLEQLSRDTKSRSSIAVSNKPIDEYEFTDFELSNYKSHDSIKLEVAE